MKSLNELKLELKNVSIKVENFKIPKNSIKSTLISNLETISKYLNSGYSLISSEVLKNDIKSIKNIIKAWIRNPELIKEIETFLTNFEEFNLSVEKEPLKQYLIEEIRENKELMTENKLVSEKIEEELDDFKDKNLKIADYLTSKSSFRYKDLKPERLEKLDVCYLPIGVIPHYCLVYKVLGDICYVMSITTNSDSKYVGYDIKDSRFFKGTVTFSLIQIPTSLAKKMFVTVYDSKSEGLKIMKEANKYFQSLIPTKRSKKR